MIILLAIFTLIILVTVKGCGDDILSALCRLNQEVSNMSSVLDELKVKLGAALDEIALDLADLKAKVDAGVDPSEIAAALGPLVDKATELAAPFHEAPPAPESEAPVA